MRELNISLYIQIMKNILVKHDKQESAGRFLLESVTTQEKSFCSTNLDSKKISRLVSRKDSVPDDIKQAALRSEIASNVKEYFKNIVVPDLNPYTKDDGIQEFMSIIEQDSMIAQTYKEEFRALFKSKNDAIFLYKLFMYVIQRENKKASDTVEYQDATLLAEVNYECPLKHIKLIENVKGVPKKKYVITHIFPEELSQDLVDQFDTVYPKPMKTDDLSNLIALCPDASNDYLQNPTVEEYKQLYEIKRFCSKKYKAISSIERIDLEDEIRIVIDGLISIKKSDNLPELNYDVLRIDQKISDVLLQKEVQNHVLQYYRYIENVFSEMTDIFDDIAGEIKFMSQKLENLGLSQEEVISLLTKKIHDKVFCGNSSGNIACMIVVCFFIQNCEVFYK